MPRWSPTRRSCPKSADPTRPAARPCWSTPAAKATAAATAAAATATGRAAGAQVVRVAGTDPRADRTAIAALAQAKPEHVVAAGTAFGPTSRLAARVATAATGVQLPGGGQVVLPGRRLVAMYGHPGTPALGVLGEQPLPQAIARAKRLAAPFRALSGPTPVVPTFELIATVAQANPGVGGDYSYEAPVSMLEPWVVEAGKAGMYVVLDLQPGRSNFLDQAKLYEPLLRLPHVGLALDPEWRLRPDQVPLTEIGSARAAEINSAYRWLADLTDQLRLPQKLFVIHQFRLVDDRRRRAARARPRLGAAAHPHGRPGPDPQQGRDLGLGRRRGAEGGAVRLEELLRRGHADAHAGADHVPQADPEHDLVPVGHPARRPGPDRCPSGQSSPRPVLTLRPPAIRSGRTGPMPELIAVVGHRPGVIGGAVVPAQPV